MDKLKKRMILAGSSLIAAASAGLAVSLAWFTQQIQFDNTPAQGSTVGAYFAHGIGTADDPFAITHPVHLYNLAWLQYLNEFNDKDTEGTLEQQYYFVLEKPADAADDWTLDMSDWVLPPIGTTDCPFVGNFNGGGYTITNLTVSNKIGSDDITLKPFSVTEENFAGVDIIGFFGVVGEYDEATYGASYDSSINSVSNFYLKDATIKTQTDTSLIGAVAGYVNGTVDSVGVIDPTLSVESGVGPITSITSNLSDYSLIGYATDDYKTKTTRATTEVTTPVDGGEIVYVVKEQGDEGAGAGGSIDMQSIYNRLQTISGSNGTTTYYGTGTYTYSNVRTYDDSGSLISTNPTTASGFRMYNNDTHAGTYNEKIGSFVFAPGSQNNKTYETSYTYLSGGMAVEDYEQTTKTGSYTDYSIKSGSYYLVPNGTSGITRSTSASYWVCESGLGTSGGLYTLVNGTKYYLNVTASSGWRTTTYTASLSTTKSTDWICSSTTAGSNRKFSATVNGTTVYIRYNNNSFSISTSSTNLTVASHTSTGTITTTELLDDGYDYSGTQVTYFPLKTKDDSYEARSSNTGYIVSGCVDKTSSDTYPYRAGDIRVSKYSKSGNLSSISTIYTIDTSLSTKTITTDSSDYSKLADSYSGFQTIYNSDSSNVYGLHFMSAQIDEDVKVNASYALVNGTEYTGGYEIPGDCIDFTMKEKGFVNFFAGTWFSGNNSFFSMHEITRSSDGSKITDIKEIEEVWGDKSQENYSYIYKYSDGTYSQGYKISKSGNTPLDYSGNYPSSYSLLFKTAQIKKQSSTFTSNRLYYFEVPVNTGEFALGCAEGGTGSYLLYLDLSANAKQVSRSSMYETIKTVEESFQYPLGVALVENAQNVVSAVESAFVTIASGSGEYTYSVASSGENTYEATVSGSGSTDGLSSPYCPDSVSLKDSSSNEIEKEPFESSTTKVTKRVYYDFSTSDNEVAIITIMDVDVDGVVTRTITFKDADGNDLTEDQQIIYSDDGKELTEAEIAALSTSSTPGADIVNLVYSYAYGVTVTATYTMTATEGTSSTSGAKIYVFSGYEIEIDTSDGTTRTIVITVSGDTYTVTVNGASVTYEGTIDLDAIIAANS